jgi:hypothetical protein
MAVERPRDQEKTALRETLGEFADCAVEKNVEVMKVLKLYIDWLLTSPKNRRILRDVQGNQKNH